ncbi:MAG: toxin-antitoxin system YwqK family antitoxin [Planctomycetales bacterium]
MGKILEERSYYVGDVLVAERRYYESGQMADEKLFADGKLHGYWREFYPNGRLFGERPYRNGVMDGVFRFFDEEGNLREESKIERGSGLLKEFGSPQVKHARSETQSVDGRKHGRRLDWGRFDQCAGIGVHVGWYENDQPSGWNYTYDEDGTPLQWGRWVDGKCHGVWPEVDRNGKDIPGTPLYLLKGKEVPKEVFMAAAERDAALAETVSHRPPPMKEALESKRISPENGTDPTGTKKPGSPDGKKP